MRIKVTYEKADILRLVNADIKAQGIRIKAGSALEYKGPLQVRFEVETDDETPVVATEEPAVEAKPAKAPAPKRAAPEEEEDVDMSGVLAASKHLAKNTRGIYEVKDGPQRQLGPNESYEFPKD